jgi:response regulator RpfG family c-di-GMP phosphodiesterase
MNKNKSILIFNRDNAGLDLIEAMLEGGDCPVLSTSLPLEAIHILQKNDIDVILASQAVEGMDGQEFKELAEKIRPGVNVLLLPQPPTDKKGHKDTISDCTLSIKDLVKFIQNYIRTENNRINESSKFKDFLFSFTDKLLQIFEVNDKYFFNNNHLVANLSTKVAVRMKLEENLVEGIHLSALLRDLGKVGVQQQILDEKSRLERDQLTVIKSHPLNTVQILKQINFPWNVDSIIAHHHEHYDGNGYPEGLQGRYIPLGSRIISVVDSYVAMTMDRPHRKALTSEEATQEILQKTGTQFDPEIVEVFFSVLQDEKRQATDKKRIIVLDLDGTISAMIKLNLSSDEFDILSAATSLEAVQYLKELTPFALIADSETLRIDKFHFYNIVRQERSTNTIPFFIVVPTQELPQQLTDPGVEFLVKPLDIEDLSSKIKTLSKIELAKKHKTPVVEEEEFKGISGSLEDLSLVDIIQLLNMGLKTAKVILIKGKEKGEIYLKSGKIVNVHAEDLTGHDAFFKLMQWYNGSFRIFHGHTIDDINVTMDTMNLLLEGSRVLDENRAKEK